MRAKASKLAVQSVLYHPKQQVQPLIRYFDWFVFFFNCFLSSFYYFKMVKPDCNFRYSDKYSQKHFWDLKSILYYLCNQNWKVHLCRTLSLFNLFDLLFATYSPLNLLGLCLGLIFEEFFGFVFLQKFVMQILLRVGFAWITRRIWAFFLCSSSHFFIWI